MLIIFHLGQQKCLLACRLVSGRDKYCTSTTATPTHIPRITPQFSRSHFSTLVTQPWRREQEREKETEWDWERQRRRWGGGRAWASQCAEERWMSTWSQPDMNRAFSKHNCWLWTESVRGRITRLSWAEENSRERERVKFLKHADQTTEQ